MKAGKMILLLITNLHVLNLVLFSVVLFHLIFFQFSSCFDIGIIITLCHEKSWESANISLNFFVADGKKLKMTVDDFN